MVRIGPETTDTPRQREENPEKGAEVHSMLRPHTPTDIDVTPFDLLHRIREAGGTLRASENQLLVRAPQPLSAALSREIRDHKLELLEYLAQEPTNTQSRRFDRSQVCCRDCAHFEPHPIGCGGIGTCRIDGEGCTNPRSLPLYPRALRYCDDFAAQGRDTDARDPPTGQPSTGPK